MIKYTFSSEFPQHHLLNVQIRFDHVKLNEFVLQLPAWRPGRYELGNFAKNIQKFKVTDEKGHVLKFEKSTKDKWIVQTQNISSLIVNYTYYAADLNAGSTYIDTNQLYVNPVNCCMYNPEKINEPLQLELDIPDNYLVACSMKKEDRNILIAENFEELADSPLIASSTLQHHTYTTGNLPVHIWFQGECRPDEQKIIDDFTKFTQWQLDLFKNCPASEYHFLIQVLPTTFYHGVEHKSSTVLAIGPGYHLNDLRYGELLGVACHELYHVWNVKTIRPQEMWPYDYTKENYFTTGFVAEGVTTYMGDYILWQSGIFEMSEYFAELNIQFQKHFDNYGRFNYSVAQSGFDNWLDGYVPGVPERKVSIYVEGCLLAFMTDVLIMKHTKCQKSIHDVMRDLYTNFYLKNKGYTYDDYVKTVSDVAGHDLNDFFANYALGTENYKPLLTECCHHLGLEIKEVLTGFLSETHFGFKLLEALDKTIVSAIHPESPAYFHALVLNDQILAVNGNAVKVDANKWINYFGLFPLELTVMRNSEVIRINLKPDGKEYYKRYELRQLENVNRNQEKMFLFWKEKK
jgi:predicted metalloprotease with PDZ domain